MVYDLLKIKNDVFTYVWKGKGEAKRGRRKEEGERRKERGGRRGRKGGKEDGEGGRGREILLLLNKIVSTSSLFPKALEVPFPFSLQLPSFYWCR